MIQSIDHIVIAVRSLDSAIDSYRALGFTVVVGGKHPYGSHNALIGFEDGSYIEVLGFYEESPAHPWWDLLHQRGGGLIDFCMATDDIRGDLVAFRAQGVSAGDLVEGGRSRPDGYHVRWINNKVGGQYQGVIPFIIEDFTLRSERLPAEKIHANGVTGIHCLSLATADLERHAAIMSAVLGGDGEPIQDDQLKARGVRFEVGSHILEYLTPNVANSPLQAHLDANKPVPYRVSFKTSGTPADFGPDQTEGVRIALVSI